MPRNEFKAGDHEEHDQEWVDGGFQLEVGRDDDGIPFLRKVYPGKGKNEDLNQEVDPVEDDPHMWPEETRPTLADLRKQPGLTTTAAHIAEKYKGTDDPLY